MYWSHNKVVLYTLLSVAPCTLPIGEEVPETPTVQKPNTKLKDFYRHDKEMCNHKLQCHSSSDFHEFFLKS